MRKTKRLVCLLLAALLLPAGATAISFDIQLPDGAAVQDGVVTFDLGALETCPITPQQNRSAFADDTVYIHLCLYAAADLRPGVTQAQAQAALQHKHIAPRSIISDEAAQRTTYVYLPTLMLETVGDPIRECSLVLLCAQHPEVRLELPLSPLYVDSDNLFEAEDRIAQAVQAQYPDVYHAVADGQAQAACRTQYGLEACLGAAHDATAMHTLLGYAAACQLLRPGMTPRQAAQVLPGEAQKRVISDDLTAYELYSDTLYEGATLGLELFFAQDGLVQALLGISGPYHRDLYATGSGSGAYNYHMPRVYVQLDGTWLAQQP